MVMRIKFASVNNFKFPPTQKIDCFIHNVWYENQLSGSDGRFSEFYIFVILGITAFSKSNLYCFIAFCARTGRLDSDMFIKKSLKKWKHTYFKAMWHISCTIIHEYSQAIIKADKILVRCVLQTKCVGRLDFKIWVSRRWPKASFY